MPGAAYCEHRGSNCYRKVCEQGGCIALNAKRLNDPLPAPKAPRPHPVPLDLMEAIVGELEHMDLMMSMMEKVIDAPISARLNRVRDLRRRLKGEIKKATGDAAAG